MFRRNLAPPSSGWQVLHNHHHENLKSYTSERELSHINKISTMAHLLKAKKKKPKEPEKYPLLCNGCVVCNNWITARSSVFCLYNWHTKHCLAAYVTDRKVDYVLRKLQQGLNSTAAWCEWSNIEINKDKSQAIYFSRWISPPDSLLMVNGWNIPFVNSVQYLGEIFDKKITW
jgi:hypothetical protein